MPSKFKCKICHNIFSLWIDAAACCACASPIEIHDIDTYRRLFTPLYSQVSGNFKTIEDAIFVISENQFKIILPRPVIPETLRDAAYLINSQFLVTADTNSLMIDGSNLSKNELKKSCMYLLELLQSPEKWSHDIANIGTFKSVYYMLARKHLDRSRYPEMIAYLDANAKTLHFDITNGKIWLADAQECVLLRINSVNNSMECLKKEWLSLALQYLPHSAIQVINPYQEGNPQ